MNILAFGWVKLDRRGNLIERLSCFSVLLTFADRYQSRQFYVSDILYMNLSILSTVSFNLTVLRVIMSKYESQNTFYAASVKS